MGVTNTIRNRDPIQTQKSTSSAASFEEVNQNPTYTDGESDEFEFGGSFGAASLMVGFPLLMWYMWIGAVYYNGQFPKPHADQTLREFAYHLAELVYEGAYPTAKAWSIYWTFFIFEAIMYVAIFETV